MSLSSPNNSQSGFSLIEVLIAMAVLVFISLGLAQTITSTFKLRDSIMNEGDFYNGIRLALEIVQRDVSLLYSPVVMIPKKEQKLDANGLPMPPDAAEQKDLQTLLATDHGQTSAFWAPATDRTGIRPSRFVGTDSKMTFIAISNIRIYRDSVESDFSKVTYELLPDKFDSEGGRVLTKTESPNAFDDDERRDKEFQRVFPLLRGISKLQYRYYKKDKNQWYSSWDSDKEDFRNVYPDIIEVTVDVRGPFRLNFEGRYRFRPEVPLRGLDTTT